MEQTMLKGSASCLASSLRPRPIQELSNTV
jgi:hypothetical protein